MYQSRLNDEQSRYIKRFHDAGGVCEFYFFDVNGDVSLADHRHAVKQTLQILAWREQCEDDLTLVAPRQPDFAVPRQPDLAANHEPEMDALADQVLDSTRISWSEFLGRRYDEQRGELIVRGKDDFPNDFFFCRDDANEANIIPAAELDHGIGEGYAYAFSSPPYDLQISDQELGELFDEILQNVIAGSASSEIYRWTTPSTFFEAGAEWWGAFLWSLSNPDRQRIVVIAAAATD